METSRLLVSMDVGFVPVVGRQWASHKHQRLSWRVSSESGPLSLHPPDGESVAQVFVGDEITRAAQLALVLVALEHLEQEGNVHGGQLERLDLAQLVRRHRRDDLPQGRERLVQRLRPLTLPHVGLHSLVLEVLKVLAGLLPRPGAGTVRRLGVRVPLDSLVVPSPLRRQLYRQGAVRTLRLLGQLCHLAVHMVPWMVDVVRHVVMIMMEASERNW